MASTKSKLAKLHGLRLVQAWLAINNGVGMTALAGRIGVDLSRLGQYRRAERPVPAAKAAIMRADVLVFLLGNDGEKLAEILEP